METHNILLFRKFGIIFGNFAKEMDNGMLDFNRNCHRFISDR